MRLISDYCDDLFEKGGRDIFFFFFFPCWRSRLPLAPVRCPPGSCRTPEPRRAHAVAKVGLSVFISELVFNFLTCSSLFIFKTQVSCLLPFRVQTISVCVPDFQPGELRFCKNLIRSCQRRFAKCCIRLKSNTFILIYIAQTGF